MKYNVHLFPIMRVTMRNIEANSQEEAIEKAEQGFDGSALARGHGDVEYAEDMDCFHVDEVGDDAYSKSVWYDKNSVPLKIDPTSADTQIRR